VARVEQDGLELTHVRISFTTARYVGRAGRPMAILLRRGVARSSGRAIADAPHAARSTAARVLTSVAGPIRRGSPKPYRGKGATTRCRHSHPTSRANDSTSRANAAA